MHAGEPLKIWITPAKGKTLSDIHKNKYDWRTDKSEIVDDFQINDDGQLHANQWSPTGAIAPDGSAIVVWEDWRNENKDIYGQMLNGQGNPVGPNFRINDDSSTADQKDASVAATSDNGFIVVWRDGRNNNFDIYGQKLTGDGRKIQTNFRINDSNSADQMNPKIKNTHHNTFLVVWEDWRNGNIDIYGQILSATGQLNGSSFKINDDFSNTEQTTAELAFDENGNGIVVWRDFRYGKDYYSGGDIFAQKLSYDGRLLGKNFMINDPDNGEIDQCEPKVTMTQRGDMIVVWRDNRNGDLDIYGQVFSIDGQARGNNFLINDDKNKKAQSNPSVSLSTNGEFIVIWADMRDGNYDIFGQAYRISGEPIGQNFRVNDAFGSPAIQKEPSLNSDELGNYIFCWTDYRFGDGQHKSDIFAQISFFDNLVNIAENKVNRTPRHMTTNQSN